VLIQLTAYGTQPDIASVGGTADKPWSPRPLADAADVFLGTRGSALISAGACISMVGFCSGSALIAPRYLQALAADRLLPGKLAALHPRFESPFVAIALTTAVTLLAGLTLDFDALVDFSNVAVIVQYVGTCAAITWLRYRRPDLKRTYRVPGGPWLMPGIGIAICVILASQANWKEYAFSAGTIAFGALIALVTARSRP
jgi:amino acid transporter